MLHYDPVLGQFRWLVHRGSIRFGDPAGTLDRDGYVRIVVDGRSYAAHRLAWLYVHGCWPDGPLDHRNRDRRDNRLSNLRPSDPLTNSQNRVHAKRRNSTGLIGVSRAGARFRARITAGGETHVLGLFDNAVDAGIAYVIAKRRLHPGWCP